MVDAGKTTLAEAMLYDAGRIRRLGRVDRGDSHLDTDAMERDRGITIFAAQAELEHAGARLTLVDAPATWTLAPRPSGPSRPLTTRSSWLPQTTACRATPAPSGACSSAMASQPSSS